MTRQRMFAGPLLAALLAVTATAEAQLYSWQDARGQWHFADRPPAGDEEAHELSPEALPSLNSLRPPGASPYRPLSPRPTRASPSGRGVQRQAAACAAIERAIERVQRRLRAGYREPTGNQLRARRRDLQERYRRQC